LPAHWAHRNALSVRPELAKAERAPQNAAMRMRTVRFEGAGVELAGELIAPAGEGPWPAAVLLHGAREGEARFYAAYAQRFAEAGVASLMFDRRGNGASSGQPDMNLFTLGSDGAAAHAFLRSQPEVDSARTGLWGYSNGAWVAALAAGQAVAPGFLVLTGAAGVPPAQAEVFRRTEDLQRQGIDGPTVDAVRRTWQIVFDYVSGSAWADGWDAELTRHAATIRADRRLDALPVPDFVKANPVLDSVPRVDSPMFAALKAHMGGTSPDMAYDPIPTLGALHCPVLVVLAEHDENVPVAASLLRFESVAQTNAAFRIEVIPGAGHTFDAGMAEYTNVPRPASAFIPGYLELMGGWMAAQG